MSHSQNTTPPTRGLYKNTLIFAIVASLVSIVLFLILTFIKESRMFVIGAALIEIGLITTVIFSIVWIVNMESNLKRQAELGTNFHVSITSCPDYFQNVAASSNHSAASSNYFGASNANTGITCINGFPSGSNTYYFAKQSCTGVTLLDPTCTLDGSTSTAGYTLNLNNFINQNATSVCSLVNTTTPASAFSSIPWTDVKGRCNSLNL